MAEHLQGPLDETHIRQLVERFYARVRADGELGPVFEAAVEDWEAHLAILTDFWCSVMLAAGRYKGNPLAVHGALPLPPERFEPLFPRWLALWQSTTAELFAPDIAALFAEKAERIARSLQAGLFFDPAKAGRGRPG